MSKQVLFDGIVWISSSGKRDRRFGEQLMKRVEDSCYEKARQRREVAVFFSFQL